jgi:regulator of protease activity HflC (stomatin/prohibitin superfamily)
MSFIFPGSANMSQSLPNPTHAPTQQQPRSTLLELLQAITGVFVVVYDGQHALKFTLGRAGNVVGPGVHWKWPIIQAYRVGDTRHTTIELEKQAIQLSDDLVYEVGARAVYQIIDLRKALIEIDNLVVGLRNRMVLAVQRVVKAQDRESIRDLPRMVAAVKADLEAVESQWGIKIHELGFSTFSPTPETLEITQLRKLSEEKLALYRQLRQEGGLGETAAVALISGSVVALRPSEAADRMEDQAPRRAEQPTLDFDSVGGAEEDAP